MSLPHSYHDDGVQERYRAQSPHLPYAKRDSSLLQGLHWSQYPHPKFLFQEPNHGLTHPQKRLRVRLLLTFEEQGVH